MNTTSQMAYLIRYAIPELAVSEYDYTDEKGVTWLDAGLIAGQFTLDESTGYWVAAYPEDDETELDGCSCGCGETY